MQYYSSMAILACLSHETVYSRPSSTQAIKRMQACMFQIPHKMAKAVKEAWLPFRAGH